MIWGTGTFDTQIFCKYICCPTTYKMLIWTLLLHLWFLLVTKDLRPYQCYQSCKIKNKNISESFLSEQYCSASQQQMKPQCHAVSSHFSVLFWHLSTKKRKNYWESVFIFVQGICVSIKVADWTTWGSQKFKFISWVVFLLVTWI